MALNAAVACAGSARRPVRRLRPALLNEFFRGMVPSVVLGIAATGGAFADAPVTGTLIYNPSSFSFETVVAPLGAPAVRTITNSAVLTARAVGDQWSGPGSF